MERRIEACEERRLWELKWQSAWLCHLINRVELIANGLGGQLEMTHPDRLFPPGKHIGWYR